jgi:hypothetical protein
MQRSFPFTDGLTLADAVRQTCRETLESLADTTTYDRRGNLVHQIDWHLERDFSDVDLIAWKSCDWAVDVAHSVITVCDVRGSDVSSK